MTPAQRQQISALSLCRFAPLSFDRRFVRSLAVQPDAYALTPQQAAFLASLLWKYRRQLAMPAAPGPVAPGDETVTNPDGSQ